MFSWPGKDVVTVWLQTDKPVWGRVLARSIPSNAGNPADAADSTDGNEWIECSPCARNVYVARIPFSPDILTNVLITSSGRYDCSINMIDTHWNMLPEIKVPLVRPPRPGAPGRYKIAFGSCSHQDRYARQPIWDVLRAEKPDAFLFIGDNIYLPNSAGEFPATRETVLQMYLDAYDRQRRNPELQAFLGTTMSFATWDDHDYGPNNADRTWPWRDVALEALELYFPNRYGLPGAPGAFHLFSWGDIDVFMLDDRSFRDPNLDPARRTFLGDRQLAWLKEGLAASRATFKLIACGNQVLADGHPFESWGVQCRAERDGFLKWLWERNVTGVIFLSGDRHFAELTRKPDPAAKGPTYWDLTSSPLANLPYLLGDRERNDGRVDVYVRGANAGIVEIDTRARPARARLRIVTDEGRTVIDRTIDPMGRELTPATPPATPTSRRTTELP